MKIKKIAMLSGFFVTTSALYACVFVSGYVPCFTPYQTQNSCENGNTSYVGVSGWAGVNITVQTEAGSGLGYLVEPDGGPQQCKYTFYSLDCEGVWFSQEITRDVYNYKYSGPCPAGSGTGTGTGT